MSSKQLAFDLEHRPALGEEDFLVADSNAEAVAWIDRYPDWPGPALVLSGDRGAGKTHLVKVFMVKSGATEFPMQALAGDAVPVLPEGNGVVIEDCDKAMGNTIAEEALFHIYNQVKAADRKLLLTARSPAARWPIALPDLASRLRAAPSVEIAGPDDMLLIALLVKLFADRQIGIDQSVVEYVVPRIERSFAAIQTFVAEADRTALEGKRRITVPLAREVLNQISASSSAS
ncbi:MAG: DNA replication protein [Rhodospirillales bacterium]|nr:DNA replication protein [Rhodospirillales bacterium]MBO6786288.1 DNA replication protein [Rhodospirillales bacterium]